MKRIEVFLRGPWVSNIKVYIHYSSRQTDALETLKVALYSLIFTLSPSTRPQFSLLPFTILHLWKDTNFSNEELLMIALLQDEARSKRRPAWVHRTLICRKLVYEFCKVFLKVVDGETKFFHYFSVWKLRNCTSKNWKLPDKKQNTALLFNIWKEFLQF